MISINIKPVNVGTKKDPKYTDRTVSVIRWQGKASEEEMIRQNLAERAGLRAIKKERDLDELEGIRLALASDYLDSLKVTVLSPSRIFGLLEKSVRLRSGETHLSHGERRELLSRLHAAPLHEGDVPVMDAPTAYHVPTGSVDVLEFVANLETVSEAVAA